MKRILFILLILINHSIIKAQTCGTGGCTIADTNSTGQYPSATFSTTSSSWSTVSAYMNAGNYTLFKVINGDVYEWTYCSDFGGSQGWDAELTLYNNSGTKLCYNDNCNRSTCSTAPFIRWTATYTGIVKLLTTTSGCGINTGSPYSKLVWRDTSGTPNIPILGVDVYSGNSTINWTNVKNAGYTFAYAKATEGVGYTDSQFATYMQNGEAVGMKMGAYHFIRADLNPTNAGAINEANWFLSVAQPYITACELPPAIDVEGSYLQSNFTSAQLTAWIQNWITTVQTATGIKPVIYIGASNCGYVNSSLNIYPLWRDDLNNTPPSNIGVWNTWTFNQYSWTATVPGIAGSQTDVNIFNGTLAQFNTFIGCSSTGIPERIENSFAIYPNPATNIFHIDYPSHYGEVTITIYNMEGKIVLSQRLLQSDIIDVSNLFPGIYNINIMCNQRIANKRLVIER